MYSLKGFMSYPKLSNNNVGAVAPLGEISTDSLTYSKEKGQYKIDSAPNALFHSFLSSEDDQLIRIPEAVRDLLLAIGQWVYDEAVAQTFYDDAGVFRQMLGAEFTGQIDSIQSGPMLSDGTRWMPQWISYQDTTYGESYVRVWFADEAFGVQYDEYEIEVIAPVETVDDLFGSRAQVLSVLKERTLADLSNLATAARGEYPYTVNRVNEYNWVDRFSEEVFETPTYWTTLIYGRAGDNPDVIRETLVDWILERSTHTREEWAEVLPDLFSVTEHFIIPLWSQYAIPNQTIQSGIHSPTVLYKDALGTAQQFCEGLGYELEQIPENLAINTSVYKSVAFLSVGSQNNRDGLTNIGDRFPDYIAVGTQHPDFARMSRRSQDWILLINSLLKAADEMSEFSAIPPQFSRVMREGKVYLSATQDRVQYLVVPRYLMHDFKPPFVYG